MLPTTIAIAMDSASCRGDSPARSSASSGSKSLRCSDFFNVSSAIACSDYDIGGSGLARDRAKPLQSGKEIINVQ